MRTTLDGTRRLLRELLRETAQSVVVVTAVLPDAARRTSTSSIYHGATLSSFTSVALDPLPLVAFSLRIPSRMAAALNAHVASSSPLSSSSSHPHFVINILSAAQTHVAQRFARPDIHPRPFADPSTLPWLLSREGIPILSGALGALSCGLVGPALSLANLSGEPQDAPPFKGDHVTQEHGQGGLGSTHSVHHASGRTGLASELFIARVLRAERVPELEEEDTGLHKLPLLYHRRGYTTVRDRTPS